MRWNGLVFVLLLLAPLACCADPARFDYYLLALRVAPAFCEDEPQRKQASVQCRVLSEAGFRAMPLTQHGLWPNRTDRKHPSCDGVTSGAFCRLPPLHLPAATHARLGEVMPAAADCLDRYQWAKHGSCSGLAEADYFAASVALTERVNRAIGEIARHTGREVSLASLRETLARADPALRDAVTFDCQTPRTPDPAKRRPMLREVRVISSATRRPGRRVSRLPTPVRPSGITTRGVRRGRLISIRQRNSVVMV